MPADQENRQRGYATNLASEFYILSALYRLGFDANLTLGNRKGIDIVVACGPGRAFTIEVKAVAGKNDWLVGKLGLSPRQHHYVALVSFEAQFSDPAKVPRIWIFAHDEVLPYIQASKTGNARFISRKRIREKAAMNSEAWDILQAASVGSAEDA